MTSYESLKDKFKDFILFREHENPRKVIINVNKFDINKYKDCHSILTQYLLFIILRIQKDYSIKDIMATLAEFTIETIAIGIDLLPKKISNILITGGGCRNIHLMSRLKERLKINFISEIQSGSDFDYIEAELIAYISARSFYKLPFTFPSTTGASKPLSGGKLYEYL